MFVPQIDLGLKLLVRHTTSLLFSFIMFTTFTDTQGLAVKLLTYRFHVLCLVDRPWSYSICT